MNKSRGRGRRPGQPDTRELIRDAARRRFLADGYQDVTMRSIAAQAGVDVALVSYYFGSKRGVFGAAMFVTANPADLIAAVIDGDRESLPERALRTMLAAWDDPTSGPQLRAVATAATGAEFNRVVREFVERELISQVEEHLPGPDARARAAAFSAQMAGVIFSRYVLKVEPIASMTVDDVVERLGPALHVALYPSPPTR